MKITILENSKVKYRSRYLTPLQTYEDIDDKTAQELIDSGDAKLAAPVIAGASVETEPVKDGTPPFDPKKEGFKGEAKLTEKQKKELEETGQTTNDAGEVIKKDETPVVPPTPEVTPPVEEKTEVRDDSGKVLTEEEIAARDAAAKSGAPADTLPTPEQAANTGEEVPPKE